MNKIIIKSDRAKASIILNGMEMKNVIDYSLTKEKGCPSVFRIEMYVDDAEIEAGRE